MRRQSLGVRSARGPEEACCRALCADCLFVTKYSLPHTCSRAASHIHSSRWWVIFARLCLERGLCPHFIKLGAPFIFVSQVYGSWPQLCVTRVPFLPPWVLSVHSHFPVFPGQSDIPRAVSYLSCDVEARLDHTFCFSVLCFSPQGPINVTKHLFNDPAGRV